VTKQSSGQDKRTHATAEPPAPETNIDLVQHVAELWIQLREFTRATERAARKNRLTPQRYLLLLMIRQAATDGHGVATVSHVTKQLQLAQSSVTELIARAEAVGLVGRSDSPVDGRQTEIRLTEEGERRLQATISDLGVERRQFAALVAELKDSI
jgi:DNA-binding MarR family transcriptional regulator